MIYLALFLAAASLGMALLHARLKDQTDHRLSALATHAATLKTRLADLDASLANTLAVLHNLMVAQRKLEDRLNALDPPMEGVAPDRPGAPEPEDVAAAEKRSGVRPGWRW